MIVKKAIKGRVKERKERMRKRQRVESERNR